MNNHARNKMRKIVLYEHSGSKNHGCEAIIRSTVGIFGDENVILSSYNPKEDELYGLDKVCRVEGTLTVSPQNIRTVFAKGINKIFKAKKLLYHVVYKDFLAGVQAGDIYLSTGGDNYCYESKIDGCIFLNNGLKNRSAKTVLWGCSIEPKVISKTRVLSDLIKYDLIVARETITLDALKENGVKNTILCPDPAFALPCMMAELPAQYKHRPFVGINISPMILEYASNPSIVLDNYYELVNYIIQKTEYNIMLVPHVIWDGGDDRKTIEKLYQKIKEKDRVFVVNDCNCMELKGYIANCRFFIGARTHTTIAAYSLEIPTMVVGYSVKAKGIARDLFGDDKQYVLPVQNMTDSHALTSRFVWMENNEQLIKSRLKKSMENYSNQYMAAKDKILSL